jgi:hypothetical protein
VRRANSIPPVSSAEPSRVRCHARRHRADPEQRRGDHQGLHAGDLLAHLLLMMAGEMTCLMRQHADDFVRRLRHGERAGVDEDAAAVDEGVEMRIVDQDDADPRFGQAGRLQDRLHVIAHQRLDLGIAHDRDVLLGLSGGVDRDGEIEPGQKRGPPSRRSLHDRCRLNCHDRALSQGGMNADEVIHPALTLCSGT